MSSTKRGAPGEGTPSTGGGLLAGETIPTIRQSPPNKQARQRGGRRSRDKGSREERNLVNRHLEIGIHSERYPLSGASRFRGSGHDIDIYALGRDAAPLVAECKARKSGGGFVQLEKWLGEFDCLFLRRNNADPLIVVPWRVWEQLLKRVRR